MQEDAQNLTKALKGDTKQQGDWESKFLKNLEDAALQKILIINYNQAIKPKTEVNSDESVIFLTEWNIFDSKVSLTAYEKCVKTDNSEEKNYILKNILHQLKIHMQLSSKNYNELEEINSQIICLFFK